MQALDPPLCDAHRDSGAPKQQQIAHQIYQGHAARHEHLIETDEQEAESGVPGLSRIPGAGRLFRNDSRSTTRRNLMVFIRPTIVRDAADMRDVTRTSYDYAVGQQREATGGTSSLESIVDMMMRGQQPFTGTLPGDEAGRE